MRVTPPSNVSTSSTPDQGAPHGRPRVLMIAYTCHPVASMESRMGWQRALQASREYDTTVLCGPRYPAEQLAALAAAAGRPTGIRFVSVEPGPWGARLCRSANLFYQGYRLWHVRVADIARQMHAQTPFDLLHLVNYCGYREPGYAWRLGIPFVWGPVGGTQSFPWRFLGLTDLTGGAWEVARNLLNAWQLRFCPRVGAAARSARVVLAATRLAADELKHCVPVRPAVELETGLDCPISPARGPRPADAPLRILWAGRLRVWKGLPLLIHAVAKLPAGVRVEVRVMGQGPYEARWRRLAQRLGVADRFDWVGWRDYPATLHHYQWADVFAFTSLRDTSGTGLIESLAAGAPIVGVDHQGAADIMTDDCAIRVPVTTIRQTVAAFSRGLERLATDADLLQRLSRGAQRRAADFCWQRRGETLLNVYAKAIARRPAGAMGAGARPEAPPVQAGVPAAM